MKTKICSKCKIEKGLDEFIFCNRTKDKKSFRCKTCRNLFLQDYRKKYPWKATLGNIKQRCNNPNFTFYQYYGGKGILCLITEEELKKLWFRDKAWLMKKPSIDRKNSNKNYTFKNCRFIEKSTNSARVDQTSKLKLIKQCDLDGKFIKLWRGIVYVEKTLGFNHSDISAVCHKKQKTAHGFIWKFKK